MIVKKLLLKLKIPKHLHCPLLVDESSCTFSLD